MTGRSIARRMRSGMLVGPGLALKLEDGFGLNALAILSDESRSPLVRLKAYFASKTQVSGPFDKGCLIGNFSAELAGDSAHAMVLYERAVSIAQDAHDADDEAEAEHHGEEDLAGILEAVLVVAGER